MNLFVSNLTKDIGPAIIRTIGGAIAMTLVTGVAGFVNDRMGPRHEIEGEDNETQETETTSESDKDEE